MPVAAPEAAPALLVERAVLEEAAAPVAAQRLLRARPRPRLAKEVEAVLKGAAREPVRAGRVKPVKAGRVKPDPISRALGKAGRLRAEAELRDLVPRAAQAAPVRARPSTSTRNSGRKSRSHSVRSTCRPQA